MSTSMSMDTDRGMTEMDPESSDAGMRSSYLAEVFVTLKPVVNDPQGLAILAGLRSLEYTGLESVRAGKYLRVTLEANTAEEAEATVRRMCDQLLANPVTETFRIAVTALSDH